MSQNHECCVQNEELCTKNEEICNENDEFCSYHAEELKDLGLRSHIPKRMSRVIDDLW